MISQRPTSPEAPQGAAERRACQAARDMGCALFRPGGRSIPLAAVRVLYSRREGVVVSYRHLVVRAKVVEAAADD